MQHCQAVNRASLHAWHDVLAAYIGSQTCVQAQAQFKTHTTELMHQAGIRPGIFDEGRDICRSARVKGMNVSMLACHPVVLCGRHIAHCSSLYNAVINTKAYCMTNTYTSLLLVHQMMRFSYITKALSFNMLSTPCQG